MLNKAQQRLELLISVTEAVSSAESYTQALQFTLNQVCRMTGWTIGEAWEPDNEGKMLVYSKAWYTSDPAMKPFRKIGRQYSFKMGEGLPGKAWEKMGSIWIPDVQKDPDFHRSKVAANYKLKAGVAIPVVSEKNVVNVLVFFLLKRSAEDKEFVKIVSGIAGQLGQLFIRKQTEEKIFRLSKEYETVFHGAQSSIFLIEVTKNHQFRYVSVNKAYQKSAGYTLEEIKGKTPYDLFGQQQGDMITGYYKECIRSGKPYKYETTLTHKGKVRIIEAELTPIFEGFGIRYLVGSSTDVTEKKSILDQLLKAKEDAIASDRLKTAFLNNISHEIRTPLNGILGFGQLLTQEQGNRSQRQQYIRGMHLSSQRLIDTIDKIVDMSMILSDTLLPHKESLSPAGILQDLYEHFYSKYKNKDLQLTLHVSDILRQYKLYTDGQLLRKALGHMLDNALKFTREGGVSIQAYNETDRSLSIVIEDSGDGIDQDFINKIYEPFSQEDVQITRGHEGSGLGLSITRGIIDRLGGQLLVDSEKGKGSRFTIRLHDLLKESETTQAANGVVSSGVANSSLSVLVADDDEMGRFLLETLLEDHFKTIYFVTNGKEAVEAFNQHPDIKLILMDVKMPVMDGLEATRQIRKTGRDVAVIAVTAHAMAGDEARVRAAGCNDYIPKPLSSQTLFQKIEKLIR